MIHQLTRRQWQVHAGLLLVWFLVTFGVAFFARDLRFVILGWPIGFWFAAQGSVLVFVAIVIIYARWANRQDSVDSGFDVTAFAAYKRRLHGKFWLYVGGLLLGLLTLALAEQSGLPRAWVAVIFLSTTLVLYAGIGVYGRTSNAAEYYVAGRRVPAIYNGMATAADWMSAASFISLAGGLYLQGFSGTELQAGGLAYVLGWTGGFCLVAILVAPYLRRMEIYTLPEFFAARYGGRWPRIVAAVAAILCSFTYVVAQIFGVGLITSRIAGVNFEIGILLGLGGVLVCSFLGGMRAVTWTQVAQYVLIMLAYLIPVSWLAYQQTGNPIAPLVYGRQLPHIEAMERQLRESVAEREVLKEYARRAERLDANLRNVDGHLQEEGAQLRQDLRALGESGPDASRAQAIRQELATMPKNADTARELWTRERAEYRERANPLGGLPGHAVAFSGDPNGDAEQQRSYELSRRNFLALMFCLMVGTAGLPHLLTRFYTTPSVSETRNSVAWSLVFIALLYISAPALAVLVKHEVMAHLVGQDFGSLPAWIAQWSKIPSLLTVSDANGDHVLQFAELKIGADLLMLATPEIGGLPYVVSVLVAAGGLAAALSTADGLLLTIGNALAHDLHPEGGASKAQAMRRVMWSKFALLVVALLAAFVAAQRPAAILYLVSASFSLAGAAFVPAMVLGIFWRRATHDGAVAGMLAGLLVTIYYLGVNQAWLRTSLGLSGDGLWWGIQPVSAGIFGVTAGLCATVLVSLLGRQHGQHSAIANGV